MELENLSYEEIQRLVADLEQERLSALAALGQRKEQAKYELAQTIKDMIAEQGYALNDIVPLLGARKRRGPARSVAAPRRSSTDNRQRTLYIDPDNAENVYSRGATPGWMKQKMQDQGYDPASKGDRDAFKANYLKVVEA